MRRVAVVAFLVFALASLPGKAQIDLTKYIDDNSFSLLDLDDHQDVTFKWTIKGEMQIVMNEGINAYDEKNIPAAIVHFDNFIERDSLFWPAFYYRGVCKKNKRDMDGAIKDLLRSIKLNPALGEAYLELGEIYQYQRKLAPARRAFDSGIDLMPHRVLPLYLMGNLWYMNRDPYKASRYYQDCLDINAQFAPAYLYLGIIKYKQERKDPTKNLVWFNKAVSADSTFRPAYFWRAMAYLDINQVEKATMDLDKLLKLTPRNVFILTMKGFLLTELQQFEDAYVAFRNAVTAYSLDEEAYMSGDTELNKRIDLQNYMRYLMTKGYGLPDYEFSVLKKTFCLTLVKRHKDALQTIQPYKFRSKSAAGPYLKALVLESLGKYDSSLANFEHALALDNDIFDAHRKRAIYRFEEKNVKGAYIDLMEMKRLEPRSKDTYRLGGIIKSGLKDYYGCIVDLSQFIKMDTTDLEVLKTRAFCRCEVKDYKGSTADYLQAIRANPKDVKSYAFIYRNHLLAHDTVAALRTLQQMDRKWKNDPDIQLSMMEIMIRMGKYDSAATLAGTMVARIPRSGNLKLKSNALHFQSLAVAGQGDRIQALELANESVKLDPASNEKIFNRAKLLLSVGKLKEAQKDLRDLRAQQYAPAAEYINKYLEN